MDKDIKVQDLQSYCRTCLKDTSECEGYKNDVKQLPQAIYQLFKQVTGFPKKHNRLFPNWICDSCCSKINNFSEFRVMSKKSTQFLEELIKSYNTTNLENVNDIEVQNKSEDECINKKSELPSNSTSNNNIEEEIFNDENSNENCNFENIFLQTQMKDDHFEAVQQFSNSIDALSPTNADSTNENDMQDVIRNIKIEEKCNNEEINEDITCKVCDLTYPTSTHNCIRQDSCSFQCNKCDKDFSTKGQLQEHIGKTHNKIEIACKYDCDETFSCTNLALEHYRNSHNVEDVDVLEKPLLDAETKSDESSDENLSLLIKFKKDLIKKTCQICSKTFASASTLQSHMLSHEEKHRYQCDLCNRGFNQKIRLKEHVQEMHAENLLEIICKFGCGKSFSRIQTALAHYRSKHRYETDTIANTNLKTPIEETKMYEETVEQLPESSKCHAGTNVPPVINNTTCNICFRNYSSEQKLKIHMRLHEEKRPFQCDQCERSFNEKARFMRHIAENHTNDVKEVACKFGCGRTFRRLETLKKHYYLKHSPPEKQVKPKTYTFICENCGRIFKNITAMREHSYTHRPAEDRPYKCEECSKSFTSKRSYKDHLTRHAGIKKFECPHCGLKKTTRKELKHHLNIHTKEKVYSCNVCAKDFNRMSGLKLHERVVHQGIRLYKCTYCDQAFGKPDTLKHHVMRHTGEKPHKCQICERSFIQVVALRAHMKTHNK